MALAALDGTKLLALMAAGGLFAVAGLWLMFRPRTDGHSAKIELFGLKFESSSAGLLVFIVGACFLATPLFAPERKAATGEISGSPGVPAPEAKIGAAAAPADAATAAAAPASDAFLLPRPAESEEQEPNDTISAALLLAPDRPVAGSLKPDDDDWYVFRPDAEISDTVRVTFRIKGGGCPRFHVLDAVENSLGGYLVCESDISRTQEFHTDTETLFVRVSSNGYRTGYELVFRYP